MLQQLFNKPNGALVNGQCFQNMNNLKTDVLMFCFLVNIHYCSFSLFFAMTSILMKDVNEDNDGGVLVEL